MELSIISECMGALLKNGRGAFSLTIFPCTDFCKGKEISLATTEVMILEGSVGCWAILDFFSTPPPPPPCSRSTVLSFKKETPAESKWGLLRSGRMDESACWEEAGRGGREVKKGKGGGKGGRGGGGGS